jgi:HSP20 family molecular chaperone IbpA
MTKTLEAVLNWQNKQFGYVDPGALMLKFREEFDEFGNAYAAHFLGGGPAADVLDEAADLMHMIVATLDVCGYTAGDLVVAVESKLERNMSRTWTKTTDGCFKGSKE